MICLFKAEFLSMLKSRLFIICAAIPSLLGIYYVIFECHGYDIYAGIKTEGFLFYGGPLAVIFCAAIFIGVFASRQHGGAIRNKLIMGHSRFSAYMSELAVCVAGAGMIYGAFLLTVTVLVYILGGHYGSPAVLAAHMLMMLLMIVGLSALFAAVSMLIPMKTAGAIATLIMVIAAYFTEYWYISPRLSELNGSWHYTTDFKIETVDGEEIYVPIYREQTESEKAEINTLKTVSAVLPFGQINSIRHHYGSMTGVPDLAQDKNKYVSPAVGACGSLCFLIISATGGALLFKRRDIK